MNSADVIHRLKAEGWKEAGGKGSHRKWRHLDLDTHVTVQHPRNDIPTGTLRNIYRQAGWKWPPP
jgi:predicted RNA binding protein YcfA (HicA-like mRNA interferase family)